MLFYILQVWFQNKRARRSDRKSKKRNNPPTSDTKTECSNSSKLKGTTTPASTIISPSTSLSPTYKQPTITTCSSETKQQSNKEKFSHTATQHILHSANSTGSSTASQHLHLQPINSLKYLANNGHHTATTNTSSQTRIYHRPAHRTRRSFSQEHGWNINYQSPASMTNHSWSYNRPDQSAMIEDDVFHPSGHQQVGLTDLFICGYFPSMAKVVITNYFLCAQTPG